jgi:uncharacterized membrane protein YphA (DoxX/SURF4 family)
MKKVTLGSRIILGLIFFIFGLNGFFQFIPQPPMPEKVMAFMSGLMQASYFFPVLKGTEVICGLMLLSGFYVPLAQIILSPIIVQIFLFHAFLAPSGVPLALVIVILQIMLAYANREKFAGVLTK